MICHIKKSQGKTRLRWDCPVCDEAYRFHRHDIDAMDFFVARHLMDKHHQEREEVSAYDSELRGAIEKCLALRSVCLLPLKTKGSFN